MEPGEQPRRVEAPAASRALTVMWSIWSSTIWFADQDPAASAVGRHLRGARRRSTSTRPSGSGIQRVRCGN